jgi:hypothetical protein
MPRVGGLAFQKGHELESKADVTIVKYAFGQTPEEARYPIVEYTSPR